MDNIKTPPLPWPQKSTVVSVWCVKARPAGVGVTAMRYGVMSSVGVLAGRTGAAASTQPHLSYRPVNTHPGQTYSP